jgi:putative polyhydroxyalkanoate system protein
MASYNVTVPHKLDQAEARRRVESFLDNVRREYADDISDVSGAWQGDDLAFSFKAKGLPIKGSLAVASDAVNVTGPLPMLAAMFRGRIEQTIRKELEKLLA